MTGMPLAPLLSRFSALERFAAPPSLPIVPDVTPTIDPVETACDALRRELEDRHANETATLTARHADEVKTACAEARARWTETEGATFAHQIEAIIPALQATLSDQIASALTPLMETAVVEKVRITVLSVLDRVLSTSHKGVIIVRGPRDLVGSIRAEMSNPKGVQFVVGDEVEVSIDHEASRIETRIGEALALLATLEA